MNVHAPFVTFGKAGHEESLLIALCACPDSVTQQPILLPESLDWERFLNLARLHRVIPLAWAGLSSPRVSPGPPADVLRTLNALYNQNALINLRLARHLATILGALDAADICALPLKGAALASVYYGSISARAAGDIDILVAPADRDEADRVLTALGHTRVSNRDREAAGEEFEDERFVYHHSYMSADRLPVEVHTRLHPNPRFFQCDVKDLVHSGQDAELGGQTLRVMADDTQFLFLATHGARHEWERLQWVHDIAVMVRRAGHETVRSWLEAAKTQRLSQPALQALLMANRLLGAAIPDEAGEAYRRSARLRFTVQRAEETLLSGQSVSSRPFSIDIGLRLYRFAMSGRGAYVAEEIRRSSRALIGRVTGRASPAAAQQSSPLGATARFGSYLLGVSPRKSFTALAFLLSGSLAESVSILLLFPVLTLLGPGEDVVIVQTARFGLQDVLGPELRLPLTGVLTLLVAIIGLQSVLTRFKNIYMADLLHRFATDLRISTFEKVSSARWKTTARLHASDLHDVLTTDIDRVQTAAMRLLMLIQNLVLLAAYLVMSFLISPAMTAAALLSGSVLLIALRPIRRHAMAYGRMFTESRQRQTRAISEFLNGLKVAKSLNVEPVYLARHGRALAEIDSAYVRFIRLTSVPGPVFQFATAVFLGVFVYAALHWFGLGLTQIVVLAFVFLRTAPRFPALQADVQEILTNLPAFEKVRSIENMCDEEREPDITENATVPPLGHEIRLDDVSVIHGEGARKVAGLRNVSVTLKAGTITALIGPSGSGKTTAADLLMGLTGPDTGTMRVDGVTITEANRRAWREQVAYVPQEVFLLDDTIENNLRLAQAEADENALWESLRLANAEDFVRRLPDGLASMAGERGSRLSGGERQRIALARALLRRPRLLILDEATSALDWESQRMIAEAISGLRGRMTIVTIAHRVSMIDFADNVIVLDRGQISEAGGYAALAKRTDSSLARLISGERTREPSERSESTRRRPPRRQPVNRPATSDLA